MGYDPKMTKNEQVKREKDGLDSWSDIFRHAKDGYSTITQDDLTRMRWFGIYEQKPNQGHFMWRIKLPGGRLTGGQLTEIGRLANDYGRGFGDITTRQDIQLHWMSIADFPDAFDRVYNKLGLYTDFACGDTPRNTTSCPLDGVLADQPVQLADLVQVVSDRFRAAGKEFSNLPRKFKTSLGACPLHCHQPQINDVGAFVTTRQRNDRAESGLGIVVGGGLSSQPFFAQSLRVFIPADKVQRQIPDIFWHMAALFRDSDELRYKRRHARLKFLVAERGWQWIRDELERRLGYSLEHDEQILSPRGAMHTDHVGIGQQANGLFYVGAAVARGRLTGQQMIAVGELAKRFASPGQDQIRLSQKQNLLLVNIPRENVDALGRELEAIGFPPSAPLWRQSLVSCTGTEFCNLAVVETKARAKGILDYLEAEVELDSPIMVSVSGCPNACAQYQIADIGLTGTKAIFNGAKVDAYDFCIGGRLGESAKFGREILPKVPAEVVHKVIAQLMRNYKAHRLETGDGDVEPFRDLVDRVDDDQLRAWSAISEWAPPPVKVKAAPAVT